MSAVTAASAHDQKSTNVRLPLAWRLALASLRLADRVWPALAARLAGRIFLTPQRRPRPARERQIISMAQVSTLRVGSEQVRVWEWGRGPTVLLVHGWEGRGAQLGALVSPLVRRGLRVVAFDGPAHGDSTGRRTNVLEFGRAIRVLAERYQPLAGVVAHSFGAAATALALRDGLTVEQVVFVAPWSALSRAGEAFRVKIGLSPRTIERMRANLERRLSTRWSDLDAATLAPAASVRLLVVHDLHDTEIPASEGRALANLWPGAEFASSEGLGHFRILRDLGVARLITDFLCGPAPAGHRDEGSSASSSTTSLGD